MLDLLTSGLPVASSMIGAVSGIWQAKQQATVELKAINSARKHEIAMIHARRAEQQDIEESKTNIEETENEVFYGIIFWNRKIGFHVKKKEKDVVVNPGVHYKWAVIGLFSYTYCYVIQLFAGKQDVKATTLLPEPGKEEWNFLGLFSSSTITQHISELSLAGISYGMCQPLLMVVFYVITKQSYKVLNSNI